MLFTEGWCDMTILDPSFITSILTPDTTLQIWQSEPGDQERAMMVITSADRVTFFGFWSQFAAADGETMKVTLTRVRDGVETVVGTASYGVGQPNGIILDHTSEMVDPDVRPGDVILVARSYVPGDAPTMTRTMVAVKLGGFWTSK